MRDNDYWEVNEDLRRAAVTAAAFPSLDYFSPNGSHYLEQRRAARQTELWLQASSLRPRRRSLSDVLSSSSQDKCGPRRTAQVCSDGCGLPSRSPSLNFRPQTRRPSQRPCSPTQQSASRRSPQADFSSTRRRAKSTQFQRNWRSLSAHDGSAAETA